MAKEVDIHSPSSKGLYFTFFAFGPYVTFLKTCPFVMGFFTFVMGLFVMEHFVMDPLVMGPYVGVP